MLEMLQVADAAGLADAGGFTEAARRGREAGGHHAVGRADAGRWRGDPFAQAVPARGATSAAYAKVSARRWWAVHCWTSAKAGDPWPFDSAAAPASCAALDPYPAATRMAGAPGV